MKFSIVSHIDQLQSRLTPLSTQHQIAFAAWCAEWLIRRCRSFVISRAGPVADNTLTDALRFLWNSATKSNVGIGINRIQRLRSDCLALSWEDKVNQDNRIVAMFATEAIDCILTGLDVVAGKPDVAVGRCAENMFNAADYEIGDEYGKNYTAQVISDPRMTKMLEAINTVVTNLGSADVANPSFTDDLLRLLP